MDWRLIGEIAGWVALGGLPIAALIVASAHVLLDHPDDFVAQRRVQAIGGGIFGLSFVLGFGAILMGSMSYDWDEWPLSQAIILYLVGGGFLLAGVIVLLLGIGSLVASRTQPLRDQLVDDDPHNRRNARFTLLHVLSGVCLVTAGLLSPWKGLVVIGGILLVAGLTRVLWPELSQRQGEH